MAYWPTYNVWGHRSLGHLRPMVYQLRSVRASTQVSRQEPRMRSADGLQGLINGWFMVENFWHWFRPAIAKFITINTDTTSEWLGSAPFSTTDLAFGHVILFLVRYGDTWTKRQLITHTTMLSYPAAKWTRHIQVQYYIPMDNFGVLLGDWFKLFHRASSIRCASRAALRVERWDC